MERTQFRPIARQVNHISGLSIGRPGYTPPQKPGASFGAELDSQVGKLSGNKILGAADKYLGVPYQMGGGRSAGRPQSLDCSSFVSRVYSDATGGRVKLTPYTDAMYEQTVPVSPADVQPGDLVFYSGTDRDQPGTRFPHVAIYAGENRVVDESTILGRVGYHSMDIGPRLKPEFRRPKTPLE